MYRQNAVWIMNDEAETALRKFKTHNGRFIWEEDVTKKTPGKLLGRPVLITKSMPKPLPGNPPPGRKAGLQMRTFLDAQRLLSCRGDFDETELAYILPDDQHTLLIRMKRPDGHLS